MIIRNRLSQNGRGASYGYKFLSGIGPAHLLLVVKDDEKRSVARRAYDGESHVNLDKTIVSVFAFFHLEYDCRSQVP